MVEAVVTVVMDQLVSTIRLEVEQRVRLVVGVRKEIESLSATFRSIRALLQDADKQQVTTAAVKDWLEELKDIAYKVDNVLDEWKTRILISRSQTGHQEVVATCIKNKVFSFLSSPCFFFHPVVERYGIALRIKQVREQLDTINRNKDQLKLYPSETCYEGACPPRALTSSIIDVSKIYGRDHDKEIILKNLLGDSSNNEQQIQLPVVTVVSIVGTGGFGKTTLAQLVFKEETVVAAFELKMWVCVSEPFERERLAKEIIQQSGGNAFNAVGWEDLHQRLCGSIKGKKFLLVLDDFWSENPDGWTPLQLSLEGGAQGSRIIITTRNEKVASTIGSTYTHRLGQLSDENCWLLFQQIAFFGKTPEKRGKLEDIGMEIAKKCKGVPLAVKTIAGLMRSKPTKQDWRNVLASDVWNIENLDKGFLPALLLSYHALPSYLKQCFMYCATFPKDEKMGKDTLVKLWMAQGYIGSNGRKELEMIGGEYFDELAMSSFFQDFERDGDGSIVRCKMHDLVHDFAQFLTKKECIVLDEENSMDTSITCKVRHMTFNYIENPLFYKFENARTLILRMQKPELVRLPQLTCLRALDLSYCDLEELPSKFGGLCHLRYLNLSGNSGIIELPQTICNLYNLQTLNLNRCCNLSRLPEEIGNLVNLRHLEIENTDELNYFPRSIGRLCQLQALHKFIVSGKSGGCTVSELGEMNYLSGLLEIFGLWQVENANQAKCAELQKKPNITSLKLRFKHIGQAIEVGEDYIKMMESFMESLQPHNNLERLAIFDYPGTVFPSWMSSEASLSNIGVLKLKHCKRCTYLPSGLGRLQHLEELLICDLSVTQLGPDLCGGVGGNEDILFPKLKRLVLRRMYEFEDWVTPPNSISEFNKFMPRCAYVSIQYCPKLKTFPALGRLQSLERLSLSCLGTEKHLGSALCGNGPSSSSQVIFPKLKQLTLKDMKEWEEEIAESGVSIFPSLINLTIRGCQKLKMVPQYLFPRTLKTLVIWNCPQLAGIQPCFPPLLEDLTLRGDVGIIWTLLLPNLKSLEIWYSPYSSLPQGFKQLKSLQVLDFRCCESLDFKAEEELRHLPMLRQFGISNCPIMSERCSRENWSILLSRIPNVYLV